MPLIQCVDCGKMISDKASACPNCGCPAEYFDTGSDYNACMAMLKTFRNDLKDHKNRNKDNVLAGIIGLIFGTLLGMIISLPEDNNIIKEEYIPVRNDYVFIHPKGTDDLIEIFVEKPYIWKVCKNGLSNCKEISIDGL